MPFAGHKIRSPSCLRPTKFKADLKDFLVVWDLAADGAPGISWFYATIEWLSIHHFCVL